MQDGVNNNDNNSQQDEDLQQAPQLLSQEEANEKYRAQQHVNRDLERKLKEALKQNDKYKSMEEEYAKLQGREAEYQKAEELAKIQQQAIANANQRVLKSEIRAAAASVLENPSDATIFLDLSKFTVSDDGETNSEEINNALGALVKERPYLAKRQQNTGVVSTPPSGARNQTVQQLTREQLKGMTSSEIAKADAEGRLNNILEGK
ncbi:hypothetical protein ACJV45_00705 [Gardnerella sp. Marseille-Q9181]|uniref:hypothetical protein n=1 Tax=Gardnerella sp. Marseille-Q9181 TaxID=3383029 RepID=UPI003AF5F9FE